LLKGKVALVTGGGGDIGRAIALALAREGANVAVCGRTEQSLRRTSALLENAGSRCLVIKADVRDASNVEDMIGKVVKEFGGLDILVNSAGVLKFSPVVDLPEEEWDYVIDVNLKGVFLCAKYGARQMMRQGSEGWIVNLSSRWGKVGADNASHYCASKFGVIGFTQSLALELGPHNIHVNAVCPGRIQGEMTTEDIEAQAKARGMPVSEVEKEYVSPIPCGRLGSPEDVAKVVVFLCSENAGYVNGEAINITGGLDLRRGGQ